MHQTLHAKRAEIAALCRRYHVRQIEVFGSAARAEVFLPESSDADLIAESEATQDIPPLEQFFGLQGALSRLLGRPVNVIEANAIRNPFLLASINRARHLVYAA